MKENYFDKMEALIQGYEKLYRGRRHRFSALKLIVWNILYLCFPGTKTVKKNNTGRSKDNCVKIAFITSGGLGDHLLFANYVYHFMLKFKGSMIQPDIYFKDKFHLAPHLFQEGSMCCNKYYDYKKLVTDDYDLVLDLAGFPKAERTDYKRLKKCCPAVLEYIEMCEKYRRYCRSAFRGNAYGMAKLCELEERTIVQRGDIYHYLGIEAVKYPIFIEENEDIYLESLGLHKKRFVTIQTGIDNVYKSHVKQWPMGEYKKLVGFIGDHYPEIKIVQIGNSGKSCLSEKKNTLDLLGKTDLEQVKVLLKNSLIHIDIEGGLVHLRNALKGGISIVLFGPTPIEFFGYKNNCNIKSDACNNPCYQMTEDWPYRCPKSKTEIGECMRSIRAEKVFCYFKEVYDETVQVLGK